MFFSLMSIGWGQFDTEPPEVVDFQFTSETTLDVTDESQELNYTISVTDDMSGTNYMYVEFCSPSGIDCVYSDLGFNEELEETKDKRFAEPIWIWRKN